MDERTKRALQLIAALRRQGWTIELIALEIGLHKSNVSRVLAGRQRIGEAPAMLLAGLAAREKIFSEIS